MLAKEAASIDVLSGGRLELGIGACWLTEEFVALGVPFASRGEHFTEWIEVLRAVWTGAPAPMAGRHYTLPAGLHPARPHRTPSRC